MSVAGGSQNDLAGWLATHGLEKYLETLRHNEIDLDVLAEIDEDDLKELGFSLGDRKRFLKAVRQDADTPAERMVERRQITVLFCDLVGSTGLASKFDPEDTSALFRSYQSACAEVTKRWGGHIAQYMGDGIMVYFGWPIGQENDAERAVYAGQALIEATAKLSAPDGQKLAARVGVATGLVMVGGVIGDAHSKLETAIGATPNVAAKVQSLASPDGVAVADSTAQLLPKTFQLDDLGTHSFSGLDGTVRAWSLSDIAQISWTDPHKEATPLIGRSAEMQTLLALWQRAQAGQTAHVQVVAGTGVGKSRLISEFFETAGIAPQNVVRMNGSAFHLVTSFFPAIEELRRQCGLHATDDTSAALVHLQALVSEAGLPEATAVPLLGSLIGCPVDLTDEVEGWSAQHRRARTIDMLVGVLTARRSDTPHVLLVEDVHWLDPSTRALVDQILAADHGGMVILTLRPEEEVSAWVADNGAETIHLSGLGDAQIHDLVMSEASGQPLPKEVMAKIVEYTDGVPLFVKELTKAVLDSGQLELGDAGYALRDADLQLNVPETLQGSLIARLDKRPNAKPVAQAAATIGRYFSARLLARVIDMDADALEQHLQDLVQSEVLSETKAATGKRFGFVHAMVQETAYASQLRQNRRDLHARIVEVLRKDFPDSSDHRPEVLGWHLGRAERPIEAAEQYLEAGRLAISQSDVEVALLQLRRGADHLKPLETAPRRDVLDMRIQASIGTALMLAKGWAAPEVQDTYMFAASLSDAATDVEERLWIMWGAWVSRHVHGRITQSRTMTQQISQIAAQSGLRSARLVGDMVHLQTAFYSGQFSDAVAATDAVVQNFDPKEDRRLVNLYSTDLEMVARVHKSIALWAQGHQDAAQSLLRENNQLVRQIGHEYTMAWAFTWGATLPILTDDLTLARDMVTDGRRIAEARSYDYVQSLAQIQMGYIDYRATGDVRLADDMMEGVKAFQATGADIAVPHFKTMVAWTLLDAGRPRAALDLLAGAEAQVQAHGETWQYSNLLRVKADALAADRADPKDVGKAYQKAVSVAQQQGSHAMALRAGARYADYLNGRGGEAAADAFIATILKTCDDAVTCPEFNYMKKLATAVEN